MTVYLTPQHKITVFTLFLNMAKNSLTPPEARRYEEYAECVFTIPTTTVLARSRVMFLKGIVKNTLAQIENGDKVFGEFWTPRMKIELYEVWRALGGSRSALAKSESRRQRYELARKFRTYRNDVCEG